MTAPPVLAPMLCGPGSPPADLAGWQAEPKWDGVRAIVSCAGGRTTLTSRNGNDVSAAYPELAGLAAGLGADAVLDGEVVAFEPLGQGGGGRSGWGRPSFERLQRRMHVRRPPADLQAEVPVRLLVFDLLWWQGQLLCPLPQAERRQRLEGLPAPVEISPVLPAGRPADDLLAACAAVGLEGFVAKKLDAPYLPGRRSPCWLKAKAARRRELVVGGWLEGEGRRAGGIGSLAVGWVDPGCRAAHPDGPCLRWAGQVGSGLSETLLAQLVPVVERFAVATSPFVDAPRGTRAHWLAPVLVVEVQFTEVTAAGTLRHPSLKGLRPDLQADQVGPGEGFGEDR